MIAGQYPTPGDTRVLIDGQWIDDTLRVSYEEQNRKTPIWGYHQKFFGDVSNGKVIITGTLAIHFRFPGYLMYAIRNKISRRRMEEVNRKIIQEDKNIQGTVGTPFEEPNYDPYETLQGLGVRSVLDLIQSLRTKSVGERAEAILKAGNGFTRYSQVLEAMFASRQESGAEPLENPVTASPDEFTGVDGGFEIEIAYSKTDTPQQGSFYAREQLVGVHLTGSRKVINAGLGGGDLGGSGQSLIEVYPFLAKKVVRYSNYAKDEDASTQTDSAGTGLVERGYTP